MSTEKSPRINDAIRSTEVRLIDAEGNQLGVVSTQEARRISEEVGLDLVEVSPDANPPVCRVMDYGKYKFQMKKRRSAAKKKQAHTTIKEIKMRPGTEDGDLQVKLRKAQEFLVDGDKVKFTIRFRGREMTHPEIGIKLLERVTQALEEAGQVEQMPKFEGRQVIMIVGPKKK